MSYVNDFALFYIYETTKSIPGIGSSTYSKAKPTSGLINVLKDFPWKISGNTEEVPSIFVTEYELTWGQTVTNIQRAMELYDNFKSGKFDPYSAMYTGNKTGFTYIFPQLIKNNDSLRSVSNSWSDKGDTMMNNITQGIAKAADGIAGALPSALGSIPIVGGLAKGTYNAVLGQNVGSNILPRMGAEEVKLYSNTAPTTLTINFPLYNTIDTASAYRNYSLVTLLTFQNLKTRTSFMSYIPPKIYRIENTYKGGIFIPVAFISKLDIKSIGTTRVLKEYGDILIPEGYSISITFQELISQSTNIFEGTMGGDKIEVVSGALGLETNLKDAFSAGNDFLKEIFAKPSDAAATPAKGNLTQKPSTPAG
jgi:hypothetical protein